MKRKKNMNMTKKWVNMRNKGKDKEYNMHTNKFSSFFYPFPSKKTRAEEQSIKNY